MKFKAGDKVVLTPISPKRQDWYGIETTIIRCEGRRLYRDVGIQYSYIVECGSPTGEGWAEIALKLIPPKQGTTTWEDIQQITGWVPNKQGVKSW